MAEASESASPASSPSPLRPRDSLSGYFRALQNLVNSGNASGVGSLSLAERSKRFPRLSAKSTLKASSFHEASLSELGAHYQVYEDAFFKKAKDELLIIREQPTVACGVAVAAGLLLMRGPRRFLFRQTLGRLQDQEAVFAKAVSNAKELEQAVGSVKLETKKLLERASFAEQEIQTGRTKLKDTGRQIQSLVRHINRIESDVTDFMDELREIPDGEALKLRKEVASMMALARRQKAELDKEITEISELGIRV